jgi:hypothetical protein
VKFTAKYLAYNLVVREPEIAYYGDGRQRQVRPGVYVDFGEQALGLETYAGWDGEQPFTQIRGGGYFDSEVAQRDKGWTDEERKAAEERLLELAENGPRADYFLTLPSRDRPPGFGDVRIYERPKPTAPWPAYPDVPAAKVAKLAAEMGLAREALTYEERLLEEDRRPAVLAELQKEVRRLDDEEKLTAV